MTKYVLSTMTNSVRYCNYHTVGNLPVIKESILVRGGAGIPSIRSGFGEMQRDGEGIPIWTADGVITPMSDEKFDILKEHWLFKKHLAKGHVKVINQDITGNHKAVSNIVKDMEQKDGFAQLNKETLKMRAKVRTVAEIDADANYERQ